MPAEQHDIWEDDEFVYIPESLFKHLPEEYREAAEARKVKGENLLRIVDKDIQGLISLMNAIPTSASLKYNFHRLRTSKFEVTTEAWMELQLLTTAFVVTYGRLFAKASGASGLSKKDIPKHLGHVHDELIALRNSRFAHNGSHESVSGAISVSFDDAGFGVNVQLSLGFYVGGRDEWKELITFIDALMHERLAEKLASLKKKTGYEWSFPSGPAPEWEGNHG